MLACGDSSITDTKKDMQKVKDFVEYQKFKKIACRIPVEATANMDEMAVLYAPKSKYKIAKRSQVSEFKAARLKD